MKFVHLRALWGIGVGLSLAAAVAFCLTRPRSAEGEWGTNHWDVVEGSAESVAGRPSSKRSPRAALVSDETSAEPQTSDFQTASPGEAQGCLRRSGRLSLDPNRLARVHARFGGQVVAIADFMPAAAEGEGSPAPRTLRFGDPVRRDQLLAVVWSKDFGEKKSDLVNSLSKLHLDREQYERLSALEKGLVAERQVVEAKQRLEADEIEVVRIERTLRSWRVDESEIEEIRDEARRIHQGERVDDQQLAQTWAEVKVHAPFDGLLLEKNVTVGDMVDTTFDLFKVGDLSSLLVRVDLFEEDLPLVTAIDPRSRRWTVRLKAAPEAEGLSGAFELIGDMVDPEQHTVALMGWLANPQGKLRAGQFVTADIPLR